MVQVGGPLVDGGADPWPAVAERPPEPGRRRSQWAVVVLVLVVGVVAVGVWRVSHNGPAPLTRSDVDRVVSQAITKAQADQRNLPPDAAVAYRTILPSLVTVTTQAVAAQATATAATASPRPSTRPAAGDVELGAGVVIKADGSVLTALHVVAGGGPITVRFADGTQAHAVVTDKQEANDIAVLGVDRLPSVVVPAVLGGGAQVGDPVFPVGNPLGLQGTLTAGVVSALGRSIQTPDGKVLAGLIQFDAAVNPGNSGGPLLNRQGQVVGVVTGLANPSRQPYFVGIGFAVPIDTAASAAGGPQK